MVTGYLRESIAWLKDQTERPALLALQRQRIDNTAVQPDCPELKGFRTDMRAPGTADALRQKPLHAITAYTGRKESINACFPSRQRKADGQGKE